VAEKDLLVFIGDEVECAVTYAGHVDALFKAQLLRESDALCFASYFPNEVQPVSIVESLAFGMPVILTRWHGLPSMIPAELSHLIEPRDVTGLADRLPQLFDEERFAEYRRCYLERYTIAQHCGRMRAVLLSLR
jgi:glycosyltransferase involved in cell wall biosynthesis